MYFKDILDPVTKRMKIRMVDIQSEAYNIAHRYMIRLNKDDFDDPHELAKYAATSGISLSDFEANFKYLVDNHKQAKDKKAANVEKKVKK